MSKNRDEYLRHTMSGDNPGACMMVPTKAYGKRNIGVGHFGWDLNPCNAHLAGLADIIRQGFNDSGVDRVVNHTKYQGYLSGLSNLSKWGVNESDFHANIFALPGVSDGIAMGYDAMRHSLVSRDILALNIINHVSAAPYEGMILIPGCDKNMPAAAMALLHMDLPGYILAGGSIKPGSFKGKASDIVSSYIATGELAKGTITEAQRMEVLKSACPGFGACGGMYTANSMFTLFEAMGISPLYSSSTLADDKASECYSAHKILEDMIVNERVPSGFVTEASFENAVRIVSVLGGSTNPILHLRAMAKAGGYNFDEEVFEKIARETPFIGNLMPSGTNRMIDLSEAGGTPAVLRYMLDNGHLDGNVQTLTGRTLGEELESIKFDKDLLLKSEVIRSFDEPYLERGHLVLVKGNLGTGWTKISGSGLKPYEGRAVVFESEADFRANWLEKVKGEGDFVVIRNEGPEGSPGIPEMLLPTTLLAGYFGKEAKIGMITDGRFSGGSVGGAPIIGHVDEAFGGGLISIIENGDIIRVDPPNNSMKLLVSQDEIDKRLANYKIPKAVLERIAASPEDLRHYHDNTDSAREGATMLFKDRELLFP